ncbi:hypothetical protein HYW44_04425 [Candidatus Daviesbacteria bacterium]|nr:hypothetical protein [Candidatus Daviesbacteria bacterium]
MNKQFVKSTLTLRGKRKGQEWIDKISKLVKTYEDKWKIKVNEPFPELSINYVAPALTSEGKPAVIKIGFPGDEEFLSEMETLKIYDGNGAVRILKIDEKDCVMLLERCVPGKPLTSLNDEEKEVFIFARVCKKIWKKPPVNSSFKNLSSESKYFEWYFKNREKHQQYLPEKMVIKAVNFFDDLIKTQGELYLLHSDLHQDNILSSERGYLAIDPKGIIGEREYESSVYILNPYKRFKENEELINKEFFAKRIELITEALDLNKERVTAWSFIKQILALIWSLQDYGIRDKISIRNARELEKLL